MKRLDLNQEIKQNQQFIPPRFELCESLHGAVKNGELFISCIDIYRELNNRSSEANLVTRVRKNQPDIIVKLLKNIQWVKTVGKWVKIPEQQQSEVYHVSTNNIKAFVERALKRSRKGTIEKTALFKKFNVVVTMEDNVTGPIELDTLHMLATTCPYVVHKQYRVSKYKLDAYIPRLKLGIEIDEHGHSTYDGDEEKEREEVLRSHDIVCIRFNPHQKFIGTPGEELVKIVWSKTISPDFITFRERNKLV